MSVRIEDANATRPPGRCHASKLARGEWKYRNRKLGFMKMKLLFSIATCSQEEREMKWLS